MHFYKDFQSKLRSLIKAIGLNPEDFSSHGFRRGGSTYAFKSGVPADLIQLHGDWRSDAKKNILSLVWKTDECCRENEGRNFATYSH